MNIRILAALICCLTASTARADDTGRQIAEQGNRALHAIRAEVARALPEQLRDAIDPAALATQVQRPQLTATAQREAAPVGEQRMTES